MQLNLKRALKLRKALESALASPTLPTEVSVSLLYDQHPGTLDTLIGEGLNKVNEAISTLRSLSNILSDLRYQIAASNVSHGVESLLGDIAALDREIAMLRKLTTIGTTPSSVEMMAEITFAKDQLSKQDGSGYHRTISKAVAISVVSKEVQLESANLINTLRRQREDLEDKRAMVNGSQHVTLKAADAELLLKLGLL